MTVHLYPYSKKRPLVPCCHTSMDVVALVHDTITLYMEHVTCPGVKQQVDALYERAKAAGVEEPDLSELRQELEGAHNGQQWVVDLASWQATVEVYEQPEVLAALRADTGDEDFDAFELTADEASMLHYALDLAQEAMWAGDGFTEMDEGALESLRARAGKDPRSDG